MNRTGASAWAAVGLAGIVFTASARAENAPTPGTKVVEGRVEAVTRSNEITVSGSESAGLAFQPLEVDDRTVVTKGGKRVTPLDIQEGDEVRASLSGTGTDVRVQRVEILPSGSTSR